MDEHEEGTEGTQPEEAKAKRPSRRKIRNTPRGVAGQGDEAPKIGDQTRIPGTESDTDTDGGGNGDSSIDWTDLKASLAWSVEEGISVGRQHGAQANGIKLMADTIKELPKYMRGGFVLPHGSDSQTMVPDAFAQKGLRAGDVVHRLRMILPEFSQLRDKCIRIAWFSRRRYNRGHVLKARAKPVELIDRQTWGDGRVQAPFFVLEISLAWWLVADDRDREQWLHFAMMEMGVKENTSGQQIPFKRQPDVVAFSRNWERFGPGLKSEGEAVCAARAHPDFEEKLAGWEITEKQIEMFAPYEDGRSYTVPSDEDGE